MDLVHCTGSNQPCISAGIQIVTPFIFPFHTITVTLIHDGSWKQNNNNVVYELCMLLYSVSHHLLRALTIMYRA